MKAVIYKKYGPPEVMQIAEVEKPTLKQDEVLIKVFAAGVTNSDIFVRSSKVGWQVWLPMRLMLGLFKPRRQILGEVVAGAIETVGSKVSILKPGDKVYGVTGFGFGAYAEYKCMKATDSTYGCLAVMPANISYEEATSAAYGGLLALQAMEKGNLTPGKKVLIYGASGTSGTIAVQYARYLGAEVTAVCSSAKTDLVKSLGADKVLDYKKETSVPKGERYDFILDAVGKKVTSPLKKSCRKALNAKGVYASIDDGALQCNSERLNKLSNLIDQGHIKPVLDRAYPMEQVIEAHRYVEQGHKSGGVAITINKNSK